MQDWPRFYYPQNLTTLNMVRKCLKSQLRGKDPKMSIDYIPNPNAKVSKMENLKLKTLVSHHQMSNIKLFLGLLGFLHRKV